MAVQYEPCPHGWHRVGSQCVKDGSGGKIHKPAKRKPPPKKPVPTVAPGSTGAGIPNPTPNTTAPSAGITSQPFTGTLTPAVADTSGGDSGGDTGTTAAPPGGDLTGTSQIASSMADAVFGSGGGYAPQLHYDLQAMQQETVAQQLAAQPSGVTS